VTEHHLDIEEVEIKGLC